MPLPHVGRAGRVLSFLGNLGRKTSPPFPVLACCLSQAGAGVGCGIMRAEIPPDLLSLAAAAPALLLFCFPSCFSSSSREPKADTATAFASQPCSSRISIPWMISGKQNTFPTRPAPFKEWDFVLENHCAAVPGCSLCPSHHLSSCLGSPHPSLKHPFCALFLCRTRDLSSIVKWGEKEKKKSAKMRISFPNHFIYSKHFIYSSITGGVQVCFGLFPSKISPEAEFRVRSGMFPVYPRLGALLGIPTWRANSELQINCFRCLFLTSLLTD